MSSFTTLFDLVLLQDLTGSFSDDLPVVRSLLPDLVTSINVLQPDTPIGVSTFLDKPISPFGSSWGDYVYRTDQALTTNGSLIQATYDGLSIGNGDDSPESQLEALLQVAVRPTEIGFREGTKRVVVLFTDAGYHIEGDGASAGITTPNNYDAVLDGTPSGTGEDYPGLNELRQQLINADILPIFAVTYDQISTYESLLSQLGVGGSVVELSTNSSNVIAAIQRGLTDLFLVNVEAPSGGLITNEDGTSASFTVTLSSQPIADVTIPLQLSDETEGLLSTDSLVFTPENWNIAQSVTVTGLDDPEGSDWVDNDQLYQVVTGTIISEDPNYSGINPVDVTVINENEDFSQYYTFTYFYGNGDSYSGYGYAPPETYGEGQLPDYYDNETGTQQGYYLIGSVQEGSIGTPGQVYVTSYTDADTGFGTTEAVYPYDSYGSPAGYYGLSSESGYAYTSPSHTNGDNFSSYYEADLPSLLQVRLNLLADNGGTPGEMLTSDQVGLYHSFFVEIQVGDFRPNAAGVVGLNLDFAWDGLILESINFDPSVDVTPQFPLLQGGTLSYDGLIDDLSGGSLPELEFGQAIGINQLDTFALLHFYAEELSYSYLNTTVNEASLADDNPNYVLDVETYQPVQVLDSYAQYNFTYYYGNGDSYTGYVYAAEGTYAVGQELSGYANETENLGYYKIDSIEGTTLDSSYSGWVYLTSYTDADTGFGTTTNLSNYGNPATYYGLGNEASYAYDPSGNSSDSYFSNYSEADILNQYYTFTYTYGNGDSYSGYGYALAGTYSEGQLPEYYDNETGTQQGYYTIDSVSAGTTDSSYNNYVYVTSYTDGDTLYGETTNLYSYGGSSGLGSEYGYAYTSDWSGYDSYFSNYSEADLVTAGFSVADNSGYAYDASIQFTTQLPSYRSSYSESDWVRPNFADTTKYLDITNAGSGILQISGVTSNVAGVTTDFAGDLLINPGESQRIQLTYAPSTAGEDFFVGDGLVLFTNDPYNSQYAIALSGKSTFNSDINYDGKVGVGDLGPLNNALKNFKIGTYDPTADIDGNGLINSADLTFLQSENALSLVA